MLNQNCEFSIRSHIWHVNNVIKKCTMHNQMNFIHHCDCIVHTVRFRFIEFFFFFISTFFIMHKFTTRDHSILRFVSVLYASDYLRLYTYRMKNEMRFNTMFLTISSFWILLCSNRECSNFNILYNREQYAFGIVCSLLINNDLLILSNK